MVVHVPEAVEGRLKWSTGRMRLAGHCLRNRGLASRLLWFFPSLTVGYCWTAVVNCRLVHIVCRCASEAWHFMIHWGHGWRNSPRNARTSASSSNNSMRLRFHTSTQLIAFLTGDSSCREIGRKTSDTFSPRRYRGRSAG